MASIGVGAVRTAATRLSTTPAFLGDTLGLEAGSIKLLFFWARRKLATQLCGPAMAGGSSVVSAIDCVREQDPLDALASSSLLPWFVFGVWLVPRPGRDLSRCR